MSVFEKVIEFNKDILGVELRKKGQLEQNEFSLGLTQLYEELHELEDSYDSGNFIGQIDAICDLMYFAIGQLYKMGLKAEDMEAIMDIIHTANMTKKRGVKKERGDFGAADAYKPEGWVSPEDGIIEYLSKVDGVDVNGQSSSDQHHVCTCEVCTCESTGICSCRKN